MIEEKAIVVAIEGERALLQTQRRSACQSCSVKQGCGTSVLAKVVGKRSSQILISNTLSASVGDELVIGINDDALVKGSLLIYALPVVFLLLAALVGEFWAKSYDFNAELVSIIAGLTGFMFSFLLIRFVLFKTRLKSEIEPCMLRVAQKASNEQSILLAP